MQPLKILFAASECQPFVKTGGLADVIGSLPKTLHRLGHDVRIVLPRYSAIDAGKHRLLPVMPEMKVQYGPHAIIGSVLRCSFPGTQMPVYFVDEPLCFHRDGIYGNGRVEFTDNDRRFAFFSMATLWLLRGLDWQPDIIHANDWQAGLLPVLLRQHPEVLADPFYEPVRTVFSIHNLAYQGNMEKSVIPAIGLPWEAFTAEGMEFYNKASFLKGGVIYSDALVTVSPTYAREIQQEEYGAGMHGTLRERALQLHGILNGIDVEEWNPAGDRWIAEPFDVRDLRGRAACKRALQEVTGLPRREDVPVVGMISRMISGKGFDLLAACLDELMGEDLQLVILGSGDEVYEDLLRETAIKHPEKLAVRIGYNHALSHQILAGIDIFLMPSRYEPCGLTQMYAMRYGAVPVARETGGLADTIFHATPPAIESGLATGFLFKEYSAEAMLEALHGALAMRRDDPESWAAVIRSGMKQDFSWDRSAREYLRVYESVKEA